MAQPVGVVGKYYPADDVIVKKGPTPVRNPPKVWKFLRQHKNVFRVLLYILCTYYSTSNCDLCHRFDQLSHPVPY